MPESPNPPTRSGQVATLDQLAAIPKEEIWSAKQKSAQARRAHRLAPENGGQLENVRKAAAHRDPSTTKLYDRAGTQRHSG